MDETPNEVTIVVNENGNYEVRGPVRIVDAEGFPYKQRETYWLCRCGQSKRKPFCDSSHEEVGFTAPSRAPRPDDPPKTPPPA